MWLMPCSSRSSSVRAASALETSPSAAAPKITRLDSCPVAPNGARSIMASGYVLDRAAQPVGQLGGGLARPRVQRAREGDLRLGPAVEATALGHHERAA